VLVKAQKQAGVGIVSGDAEFPLGGLAQSLIRTRVDLIHFPLTYYFRSTTEEGSLPKSLCQLLDFAELASCDDKPERVHLSGAILKIALIDMASQYLSQ
jgi:hypothetical protein